MDLNKRNNLYQAQAGWTRATRNHLYRRAGVITAEKVLEVGCGTGAIISELTNRLSGELFGVDIDYSSCRYTRQKNLNAKIINTDGLNLPFKNKTFDVTLCHYYLIWISQPEKAFQEMMRVTKNGGRIIIASEPDYEGIIEYPETGLKQKLISNLKSEGMKRFETGRKVKSFVEKNAEILEAGVISQNLTRFEIGEIIGEMAELEISDNQVFFQPIFYLSVRKH